ncbi:FMN-dependent NADH-azoreductase [Agrobacterium sp. ES01]|uniref:FMN-dependent NADH-azoreductase n=1 Tax=Agrobacterium sp. ES01 TaxID=3420714 RepID=UPI003D14B8B6
MTSILHVSGSTNGESSLSNRVAQQLIENIAKKTPGAKIVERDLHGNPLPHIGSDFSTAIRLAPDERSEAQAKAIAASDVIVDELLAADTIVLSTGFVNFGITSTLKSWIDHAARAGRTFQYTANGPEGLVKGKKAYIVVASGGVYSSGPAAAVDFAEPYLRAVLGFLGITDVETIRVEGVAYGPEAAEKAIAEAESRAKQLAEAA